jgi:hypothetical protein
LVGGADDGEGEEGGVDYGLLVVAEVESVGGFGVASVADGETGPLAVTGAQFLFFRVNTCAGTGFGFEPRGQTAEQAAYGLEVGGVAAGFLLSFGAFVERD